MENTKFYQQILGLSDPWSVTDVETNLEALTVLIQVKHDNSKPKKCPECALLCTYHDHTEIRHWRHLDTCQFETYIATKIPRIKCPKHGVK